MHVLDVGCGSGEVTLRMAALVGAAGQVVEIDLDPAILEAARRGTEDLSAPVSFRHLAVDELKDAGAYDFVFARYLLSHLPDPERAFAAMVRALRPGGRLAVEDVYFPGHICFPPSRAFQHYVDLYQAAVRAKGADPTIGPRLMRMALDAGLVGVEVGLVVPTFRGGDGKRVAQVTMEHIRGAVVGAGLATDAEVDALVAALAAFADDSRTLMSMAPTFQVWGRKALSETT